MPAVPVHRKREELEADSSPFALPKAEGFDKRTPTLGTYQSAI